VVDGAWVCDEDGKKKVENGILNNFVEIY